MVTLDMETNDFGHDIKTYKPLLTGNHDFYNPWGGVQSIGIIRCPESEPLTIRRYRRWYQITVPIDHEKCSAIENWIPDNLVRGEYLIHRTKNQKHYKFRDHSVALMCILAVS